MSLINDSDYLQQMLNKFVELRLPLQKPGLKHNIYYSQGKTIYKLGCNSGSISVIEKENSLIYTGFIKFQTHHNYLLSQKNWTYNLLALQNYQILDLSKPQVFDGIEYPTSAIFYKLEMPAENWKLLVRTLEKQQDFDENTKLYDRTLSIFFDPTIINSSNYKKIERNGERHLHITIYPNCFIFKPEVYWLPEAGLPIEVKVVKETTENFGFCGADKLYPVTEARLHYWSTEYSAKSFYPNDTLKHKIGNKSVKRVMLAFERLENVTTWVTGENSISDVKFKWDLIVQFNNQCYPLQIKSSYEDAINAEQEYKVLFKQGEIPFVPVIFWTNLNSSIEKIALCFGQLLNVPLKPTLISSNSQCYHNQELPQNYDNDIYIIGTGNKAHKSIVDALFSAAYKGEWDKLAEDLLQAIVERDKNPHYQLIKHCRIISKARTIQANVLEEKAKSLG